MGAIVLPLVSARKSATEDLISTIKIVPSVAKATISARRPDSSGNSVTLEKSSRRNSRLVPRATNSAVSDWRPSCGMKDLSNLGMQRGSVSEARDIYGTSAGLRQPDVPMC
jgi:hypothetical protein